MEKTQFMKRAVELSRENMRRNQGGPFGAVIVKDGKIIGEGWNKVTSHFDPTAHAEIEAIREAAKYLNNFNLAGCEIYTSCEPCPMCLSAIYWARLDRVYYANTREDAAFIDFDDAKIYEQVNKPIHRREIPFEQLNQSEAYAVFLEWNNKPDKVPY